MSRVFIKIFLLLFTCAYVNAFAASLARLRRKPLMFGNTAIFSSSELGEEDEDSKGDSGGLSSPIDHGDRSGRIFYIFFDLINIALFMYMRSQERQNRS